MGVNAPFLPLFFDLKKSSKFSLSHLEKKGSPPGDISFRLMGKSQHISTHNLFLIVLGNWQDIRRRKKPITISICLEILTHHPRNPTMPDFVFFRIYCAEGTVWAYWCLRPLLMLDLYIIYTIKRERVSCPSALSALCSDVINQSPSAFKQQHRTAWSNSALIFTNSVPALIFARRPLHFFA